MMKRSECVIVKAAITFLSLALPLSGQTNSPSSVAEKGSGTPQFDPSKPYTATNPPLPELVLPYRKVDCSIMHAPLACPSFNEMVDKKDSALLDQLRDFAFVCFEDTEDTFIVISFRQPSSAQSYKKDSIGLLVASGRVGYFRYKNGVSDDVAFAHGSWIKTGPDDSSQFLNYGVPHATNSEDASIDDSEANFSYKFRNLSKLMTAYSIQVRRSTLRFVETYQWEEINKDKKQIARRVENTGFCAEFRP